MASILCSICNEKELNEDNLNMCLNCGSTVCSDDYDSESGFCKNCMTSGPYQGC